MLIQYVEGDIDIVEKMKRTGKYEKCQMRYNIHMEDELNNSRLWLTRNYEEALYHRLDKDLQYDMDNDMDMELQRISQQYGMLNFIIYDIDSARAVLTEKFIKDLHFILKNGTSDSRKDWFAVGDYKKLPNEVGGMDTTIPEEVADKMKTLLMEYNAKDAKTFEDILDFHVKFERIHPFQDGNGRIGRLIMFKECLKNNIVPFIVDDNLKMFYYRGLKEWDNEKGYLTDTCLTAQDKYKAYLDYFRIVY